MLHSIMVLFFIRGKISLMFAIHLLRYLHLLISLLTSDSLNSLLLGLQLFCGSYLPVVLQVG